jgi:AcrR family transcriptional regulator
MIATLRYCAVMSAISVHVPRSRRDRPAKAPLSREAIVHAGLDLLETGGLANLSLRKIASALDTGSASLYVYVENIHHLHALMLDTALSEIRYDGRGPAAERVKAVLESYLEVMLARRGLAQLAATTMPEGENWMRLNEFLLAGLLEAGVAPERAAWGIDLLLLQVTAKAAELTAWGEQGDVIAHTADTSAMASATSFPRLHELHDLVFAGTTTRRLAWALDALLDGIAHTPLPP